MSRIDDRTIDDDRALAAALGLAPPPPTPEDAAAAARAAARFAAGAPADAWYAVEQTPVGTLVAVATPRGLARLAYADWGGGVDAVLDELAARLSPRVVQAPGRLDAVRRELEEYFAGRRRAFDLPIDWSLTTPFARRVLQATAAIPFGETSTYAAVAAAAGSPRGSRAAGNALGSNPVPVVVPCHRVLRSGGVLGGYTGGLHRKELLLRLEGVLL
ncbi:MAG TPA: methylated-DNA--[protein]-cysteine S-methyltransferase [Solirubrobacteraceae bacterium]|nr:methylated-DNA--[protein]-cysteine S-methyltransferase [Solirubrobacteraceae bacterium]